MSQIKFKMIAAWAERNLQELQQAEYIRKQAGAEYPQDISISLRNLKDEYHKIMLACADHQQKLARHIKTVPELVAEYGTPPSPEEVAIFNHQQSMRHSGPQAFAAEYIQSPVSAHDAGNQDWGGANPAFNPRAGE